MTPQPARIALVTGAASGIGFTICEHLACIEGATICALDRDQDRLHEAVESIKVRGGRAVPFCVDLGDLNQLQQVLLQVDHNIGSPDIVINSAAFAAIGPAISYPLDQWQLALTVNLTAPFVIAQHTIASMAQRGWGRIVNVASISGLRAGSGRVAYGTSKAGLIALTRQLAIETAASGITVNAVAPGPIETPLTAEHHDQRTVEKYRSLIPMRRYGTTAEVVHAISFLVSPLATYITGETLAVDGGFTAGGILLDDC